MVDGPNQTVYDSLSSPLNHKPMDIITLAQDKTLQDLKAIQLPYVQVSQRTLGGIPSVFINVSLDYQDDWTNNIFYNSRYSTFVIHDDMKLEQITKHHKLGKHRKCKINSVEDIISKVEQWATKQS